VKQLAARLVLSVIVLAGAVTAAFAQIKAVPRPGAAPPWTKGIVPITPETYYAAIECGKQGGQDPPCVFWDTGLCRNDDFTIAMYTGYKQVAYEVWNAVRRKQPAPQPNYQAAQQTKVTIGITATPNKNALTDVIVKRAGKPVAPVDRSLANGGGRFTFENAAFAATAPMTLDMVGKARTISCAIDVATLKSFR
jgi:hypothetical protein